MGSFTKQYNFRVNNQIKLIFALRNGPLQLNELAEKLGVSFTAIAKITDQLKENGVIVSTKRPKNQTKGRIPKFVKINTKVGVTCAIDLSGSEIVVVISDLRNRIVVEESYKSEYFIEKSTLDKVVTIINDLLKRPEVENRPLLGICISAPGLVNKDTGEIVNSYKLSKLKDISISHYFSNKLGVPTNLYNNVKIGLVGEKLFGSIPLEAHDYMFVRIGSGCSFALSIGGKLYQGNNGYSGELSNFDFDDEYAQSCTNNQIEAIEDMAIRADRKCSDFHLVGENRVINNAKFIELYKQSVPEIVEIVEENIKRNAIQLISYNDMLDLEYIIIAGNVLKLGDYYKEKLVQQINRFSKKAFKARILFSTLDRPSLLGAVYQANNLYFLRTFESITNEKCSTNDYDISEAFGNNI